MYKARKGARPVEGYGEPVLRIVPVLLLLILAACGPRGDATPAPPLGPEHYAIADDDTPANGEHLRYAAPEVGRAGGLDIAITEFAADDARPPIALVGVVHVADAPYFEAVQAELDRYPVVLYEGVKPEEFSNEDFQKSFTEKGGDAAQLQRDLTGWFGFQYQLDAIDYTRKNFVHADMSMEDFLAAGGGKFIPQVGENAEVPTAPSGDTDTDTDSDTPTETPAKSNGSLGVDVRSTWQKVKAIGDAVLGRPGPMRSMARKMFAKTMGTTDIGRALEMQPGFSELILIKRNEVVIERLNEVLPEATGPIAIFYGAAHMDDLQERLEAMGYKRTGARWLRAWAIRPPLR